MSERTTHSGHTATPWELLPQNGAGPMIVRQYDTGEQMRPTGLRLIAHMLERGKSLEEDRANAAFIVKAVNNHEALVEALKAIAKRCDESRQETGSERQALHEIAAVALATAIEAERS